MAAVIAPVVALTLALAACSGSSGGGNNALQDQGAQGVKTADINEKPLDQVKDGGDFKWPVDQLPDNWNVNQVDGTPLDGQSMFGAVFPYVFTQNADATVSENPNYVTSVKLVSTDPQVVEYKLNPKAKWSNGRAFSWEDFAAQAKVLNGKDPAYEVSQTTGYQDIAKVEKGTDDLDVKVTFAKKFAEWKSLFIPLYPKELNADAETFNKSFATEPKITAGVFKVQKIDQTAKTVVLERDPNWWGTPAKLDTVTFKKVERPALADAFANGQIDFYNLNNDVNAFKRAQGDPNTVIRQSTYPDYTHVTFNGASSSILADKDLRLAIFRGIDTVAISKAILGQMQKDTQPLGNHIFLKGAKEYVDNSGPYKFDVEAAKKQLDQLGWKTAGDFRAKDGKELKVRLIIPIGTPISQQTGQIMQSQLKAIGVNLDIQAVPSTEFFKNYVNVGNFDMTLFRWISTAFPIGGGQGIYYNDPKNIGQNYGHIGDDKINQLYDTAAQELDDSKRAADLNEVDKEIWAVGHQLPIFQSVGAFAVRKTVANYGSPGFANTPYDFAKIGFVK
ncbi:MULTISPECIES: ABC transporter family substrate-binding protein [unclassified Amycolatopsis]|uniref:ABC transporter family substrate-binding protein n=1 Tax=unclassified Amycolatopsis TaxID=2618356 RepID=UPI002E13C315|nr:MULTISPECIES: ABC transporter family substrate-binding protein [unclassified Amycolatopsis]WSJ80698.1 ABC transporter family substrate-binding protein [Amycolatopsis sp. NBC_01307]WSK75863.1 ABC transporter family substrate-binding protein [Amycolatopsis sp. NBC_01286]